MNWVQLYLEICVVLEERAKDDRLHLTKTRPFPHPIPWVLELGEDVVEMDHDAGPRLGSTSKKR